jgi:tetratricopeptide (TPR) repeat protein
VIKHLRGDLEEAERLGEQTRGWLERTGETFFQIQNLVALAQYALARDDVGRAEERLREALPLALAESATLFLVDIYRFLSVALLRQGRVDDAAELLEFARRGIDADEPYVEAALKLAEAALATAKREGELVRDRYEEALTVLEQLGMRIDLSQARIAYARALRELGDTEATRAQLELAREAAVEMGATGLAAEAERELALVGAGRLG